MLEYKTVSLIKKNDVIKAIDEEVLNVTLNKPWSMASKGMARNTLYALKQTVQVMPEIEKSGWISVKERMPPLKEKVLVWAVGKSKLTMGKTHCDVTFTAEVMGEVRWWEFWLWFLEDWDITHWMPLPDAPEVEDE